MNRLALIAQRSRAHRSSISGRKCSVCGKPGHRSDNGACSKSLQAERLVRLGHSFLQAARAVGISTKTVCDRMKKVALGRLLLRSLWRRQVDEHW